MPLRTWVPFSRTRRATLGLATFALALTGTPAVAGGAEGLVVVRPDSGPVCTPLQLQVLQPDPSHATQLADDGVGLVTLELGWDAVQPLPATVAADHLARRSSEAQSYRDVGIEVVLDLGLQYPPAWAWDLPGATRFVNQYGEEWHGTTGTDVLNAVWNPAVRAAQSAYVRQVAQEFRGQPFAAVRVGGLLSGETRLPPARVGEHTDALWGFDDAAIAASPVPGWRPGEGPARDADAWLDYYLDSVAEYQLWLVQLVAESFPGTPVDVLLPGWGLRPGDVERAGAGLLDTAAVEATVDSLSSAVDWDRQIRRLAAAGVPVTLVTTWLDAPGYGPGPRDMAPAEYLARLASDAALPVSGENTGGGGQLALSRLIEQSTRSGVTRVAWLDTVDGAPLSLVLTAIADANATHCPSGDPRHTENAADLLSSSREAVAARPGRSSPCSAAADAV